MGSDSTTQTEKVNNLEDLGYDDFFETNRNTLGLNASSIARVTAEHRGAYDVINRNGKFFAKITGKQMLEASSREDYPAVGDWIAITELEEGQATIDAILPRKTMIKRKFGDRNRAGQKTGTQIIATNIDIAFAIESVGRDYNMNRFERYFALAAEGGVKSAIILNKVDLITQEELEEKLSEIKNRFSGVAVIPTSIVNGGGLDELNSYIVRGKTYCFLGSSGVGKSSLINQLIGQDTIKTGGISSYSERGKHTTTNREMYFLQNGGIVIDTPGMREVGMVDATSGIDAFFDEITALGKMCKYADCAHIQEPGCQVLEFLRMGKLDKEKYENYIRLRREAEYSEMTDLQKRQKNRSFGKFIKKAKKELKNHKS